MKSVSILRALLELSQPLVIITVGEKGERAAMTACWLAQVSWKPPYVGVAIYNKWRTLELILKYGEFAVNIVSEDLVPAALLIFGAMSSRKVDKIELAKERYGLRIERARQVKASVILDSPTIIECKLLKYYIVGDHYLLICDPVEAYKNNDKRPVTCFMGTPHTIGERVKLR